MTREPQATPQTRQVRVAYNELVRQGFFACLADKCEPVKAIFTGSRKASVFALKLKGL